jgi:acetolactate synthase-1/2/3 large subunit
MKIRGAEIVIKSVLEEGVHTLFGYPGGAIMPVYDALYDYREIVNHVLVRHEQGAIHAAQGFARASGKVSVCLATSGPGATNLLTGLADAMIDSTPVVCITGQVASHLLGTDAFQETDVMGISMPVTKWNVQVTRAEEIAPALAKAFYLAQSGRPGPVLVDITKDAQFGLAEFHYEKCTSLRSYVPTPNVDREALQRAAEILNTAQKPFMIIGQGVLLSKAENEVRALAEQCQIPVASTLLGLGAFPTDHPLYVGYVGMHGNYAPNVKTNECDVLLAVGMRFDDRVTGDVKRYANQAKIIHLDIDPAEINKIIPVEVGLAGDAKQVLMELLDLTISQEHASWLHEFRDCEAEEFVRVIQEAIVPTGDELKMAEVVNMLSEMTEGKALVVTDVGQHQMIASRYYRFREGARYITSGGLGTMGFGLPAAIGAKLGAPHQEVIAVIGDGGFQMTIQELGTILQSKMAVKIVLLNNNFLGMVRQWQQLFFDRRYSFTDIQNPNFVTIAAGYGIPAEKIENRADLRSAIDRMLLHEGSYLLEVVVEREENVFPMVPTGASVSEIRLH